MYGWACRGVELSHVQRTRTRVQCCGLSASGDGAGGEEVTVGENAATAAQRGPLRLDESTRSAHSHHRAFKKLASSSDVASMRKRVEQMRVAGTNPDTFIYNVYIDALGQRGPLKAAVAEFERMQREDARPNIVTYTTMMKYYKANRKYSEVRRLMQEVVRGGLKPTAHTYTVYVDSLAREGDAKGVEVVISSMLKNSVVPSTFVWAALMRLYANSNRNGRVYSTFEKMRECGVVPDEFCYSIYLGALGSDRRTDEMWATYQAMQEQGCRANVVLCTTMIKALARNKDMKNARLVFDDMVCQGVAPNEFTYNTMIRAYGATGKIESAELLFERMKADPAVSPCVVTYTTLISSYARLRGFDRVTKLVDEMRSAGVQPNEYTYNVILDALGRVSIEMTENIFRDMLSSGIRPSTWTYNTLMKWFNYHGMQQSVEDTFEDLYKSTDCRPDIVSVNTLISSYSKSGDIAAAERAMGIASDLKLKPDVLTCNAMLIVYVRAKSAEKALCHVERMRGLGIVPDRVTFKCIIAFLIEENRLEEAREFKREANRRGHGLRMK
eukprot:CAMPEP_0198729388 /NCGR_PEP_ID=MMETSP1475-20131203/17712_1 /TAXON_ID= ORGANISM="Unidentified sp., Strain CCMP1999" /NCGR_SAMPLE_ID=MMETSP1475 /ASSEMBLY_ACC=CAM_ASM_001111 /LENGTH=554 /DNA_ID=CAMNT_0044492017 /DNA_START=1 /DNA_END=1662 /DNA_ORIENTATION=+